jgi:hypothetical protein
LTTATISWLRDDYLTGALGDGLAGATAAAWPAVTLVGSNELLMMIIRSAAGPVLAAAIVRVFGVLWFLLPE